MNWLASPQWTGIVKALLHTLWQGGFIAVLLWLALRRVDSPVSRYRCLLGAMVGVLLAGVATWGALNRPIPQIVPGSYPTQSHPFTAHVSAHDLPPKPANSPRPEAPPADLPWTAWLALVWLAGATVMIGRSSIQVAGAERLRRSSRPLEDARIVELIAEVRRTIGLARRVQIGVTDKLTSPAVVGVLVPTLILPLSLITTLTPEQIRFVLLHELAHVRRGDYFANLFQLFAEALLFFNPAVWWISRQLRIEREACCDLLAIELSGAPADYARTLLHVAENVLSPSPLATMAFGDKREPSSLSDRVHRMLVPGYRPRLRLTWRAMIAALLAGTGLLFLSALGTRITIAAILSPRQRIERIEKRMTELGEKPVALDLNGNDESLPKIKISGRVRTADGSPLPKWMYLNVHSALSRSSCGTSVVVKDGIFTGSIRIGTIFITANATGFAPTSIGPLDGLATNHFENLEVVLERGFNVPLQVVDKDSGKPLPEATAATMFWMNNEGFQPHSWKAGADGLITLTHCANLPLDVTVNVAGYVIVQKKFDHVLANEPLIMQLQRGGILSGTVLDKTTGKPVTGAEFHLLYQTGRESSGPYQWTDSLRALGKSDAGGAFTLNQLRRDLRYYLGISATGHESVVLTNVSLAKSNLVVQLGPELIVRGRVSGKLEGLQQIDSGRVLNLSITDKYENNSYGHSEWVRLHVTNGIATFQFTNRVAGPVTLTGNGYREERDITAPINDWVVDLAATHSQEAKPLPKREVVFRFTHWSGMPPRGTVEVTIPDNLDQNHLTAHMQDMEFTNSEVRAEIAIGGRTSIEPKRMVGYWFDRVGKNGSLLSIVVTNGPGPMVIEIPLVPAGAIYASARNADGTPAGGLIFGVSELKRAPGRDESGPLDGGSDAFSNEAPRKWVSGPLPLGGTYQIHAWRGNSFCVSQPVNLTGASPDAEVELQFQPGKTFEGMVLDSDGKPLRDIQLKISFTLLEHHGFGLNPAFTDERGRFKLENATPGLGEYFAEADAPGMQAESVKLKFGSQPQTIRLKHGRSLAGRVVQAGTGYAIPGVEVRALDFDLNKLPMLTTHTDAGGRFEFSSLGSVKYTLYVADGELLSNKKFYPDGNANVVLAVKLYGWSKTKPTAPAQSH